MSYAWLRNSVSVTALIAAAPALAGEAMVAANQIPVDVFNLGQIETVTITGTPFSGAISESTVNQHDKRRLLFQDRVVHAVESRSGARHHRSHWPSGGRENLLDQSYQLVGGFPSEGRSFFVNLRIQS